MQSLRLRFRENDQRKCESTPKALKSINGAGNKIKRRALQIGQNYLTSSPCIVGFRVRKRVSELNKQEVSLHTALVLIVVGRHHKGSGVEVNR